MALKTKLELETLDVVYLGQPFVQVATKAITATNLDTVYQAQPFYAVDPAGSVVEEGAAALSSTASIAVTGQVNRDLDAVLQSQATIDVIGSRSRNLDSALSSATDLAVTATKTIDADVYAQADSNLTVSVSRTVDADIYAQSEAALATDLTVVKTGSADLSSDTDVTVSASRNVDADVYAQSEFALAVSATVNRNLAAVLESFTDVTAQGTRERDIDIVAFSESAVSTTALRIRNGEISDLFVETDLSVNVAKTIDADVYAQADFALTAELVKVRTFEATMSSTATVACELSINAQADAVLSTDTDVTVTALRTKSLSADLSSAFTVTADVNYTINADVFTEAEAALTANGGFLFDVPIDLEASAGTLTAAAKVGTFAADLPAVATMTVAVGIKKPASADMSSAVSMSTNGGKLIEVTVGQQGGGVAINGTHLKLTSTASGVDERANNFLISFWANNADGTVLQTSGADNDEETFRISFDATNNRFEVYQRTDWTLNANDNRTIRWNVNSTGWHHYVLYQDFSTFDSTVGLSLPSTTRMTLIVDGVIKPVSAIINNDTTTSINSSISDSIFLRNGSPSTMQWFIGAIPDPLNYAVDPTDINENFTGEIQQFAVWFADGANTWNTAVPNAFDNIEKLYSTSGPLDLGSDGTATGLRAPEVYLRLDDYTDYSDLGALPVTVSWLNLATTYTPTSADNADPYNYPISSIVDLDIEGQVIQTASANINATASLSVTARKSVQIAADVTSTASVDAAALRTKQLAATILAEGFVLAAVGKISDTFVPLVSTSTLSCSATATVNGTANITAATDFTANAVKTTDNDVFLSSEATVLTDAAIVITGEGAFTTSFTSDFTVRKTARANIALNSATDLLAIPYNQNQLAADLFGTFTLTADAVKTVRASSDLSTQATVLANVGKKVAGSAVIQSNGFILVAGDVFKLDPELTYVIEQETRTLVITGEDRELIIDEETRIYVITEETRDYLVEQNTAVNII
jgi:hypothetical protein